MSSTFILFILFFMLICVVLFYVFTQQSLNDISSRLNRLQPTAPVARTPDVIRRERAYSHDQLVLLEADLSTTGREDLTEGEVQDIDKARKKIKICVDELKASGDWIGLPFDFEWTGPKFWTVCRMSTACTAKRLWRRLMLRKTRRLQLRPRSRHLHPHRSPVCPARGAEVSSDRHGCCRAAVTGTYFSPTGYNHSFDHSPH
jgi:hypothetical protein